MLNLSLVGLVEDCLFMEKEDSGIDSRRRGVERAVVDMQEAVSIAEGGGNVLGAREGQLIQCNA